MIMTTNKMLKKVLNAHKGSKKELLKLLCVDVEKCQPHDVTTLGYDKDWKENYFLYLNENYRILGVLRGSAPVKEFESYCQMVDYPRNRKNLTPNARYILMITPEMRKWRMKNVSSRRNQPPTAKELLRKRLESYKMKKNEGYDLPAMQKIIKDVMDYLTANMFDNSNVSVFRKFSMCDNDMFNVIRNFADNARDYITNQHSYEVEVESAKKHGWPLSEHTYYYESYTRSKLKILEWYKTINELKQSVSA